MGHTERAGQSVPDQKPRWLTLEEVATALLVGVPTVERLIEDGLLMAEQRADQTVVSEAQVFAFLRENQRSLMEKGQPEG